MGREESSQAPESRDRGSPLGRQCLHMQQLQQGLPVEDHLGEVKKTLTILVSFKFNYFNLDFDMSVNNTVLNSIKLY